MSLSLGIKLLLLDFSCEVVFRQPEMGKLTLLSLLNFYFHMGLQYKWHLVNYFDRYYTQLGWHLVLECEIGGTPIYALQNGLEISIGSLLPLLLLVASSLRCRGTLSEMSVCSIQVYIYKLKQNLLIMSHDRQMNVFYDYFNQCFSSGSFQLSVVLHLL